MSGCGYGGIAVHGDVIVRPLSRPRADWHHPEAPGLDQTLAAVRAGDTLVVPKLDRLARSVPDARAIGDDLAGRGIKLSLGGQVYDPADPMGKMFFNILATFAEFGVDLLRMRTREGMAIARAKGKLRGKQPKLSARQQRELARMAATGEYTIADLAELFTVSRATVYRTLQRTPAQAGPVTGPPARASEQHQGFRTCTASVLPLIPARFFLGPRDFPEFSQTEGSSAWPGFFTLYGRTGSLGSPEETGRVPRPL